MRRLVFEHELMWYWHWVRVECISYCSVSRNDSKYQWYAVSARLCPSHREFKFCTVKFNLSRRISFIFMFTFFSGIKQKPRYLETEPCQRQFDFWLRDRSYDLLVAGQASLTTNPIYTALCLLKKLKKNTLLSKREPQITWHSRWDHILLIMPLNPLMYHYQGSW